MNTPNQNKLPGMLGLAAKAGLLITGADRITEAVRRIHPFADGSDVNIHTRGIVLVASDASENTKKRMRDFSSFYGIRLAPLDFGCDELAHCTGCRGTVATVAVLDKNFSQALEKLCCNN